MTVTEAIERYLEAASWGVFGIPDAKDFLESLLEDIKTGKLELK